MWSHSFHAFCQLVWGQQEPCHIRTPVNVEFVHETEDVLGEHFGLDLIHAVSGYREAREPPAPTQARMREMGKTESSKHRINQKNPEINDLVEGTPPTCRGSVGAADLDCLLASLGTCFYFRCEFISHFICNKWKLVSNVLQTKSLHANNRCTHFCFTELN